ncbi:MAG: response regulator transcription factor [Spirochaetaceae bacterium]|jgi:DNA-binding NarL/FixJ family response regulator|nr:response regulator transcription factor [Spirochaetaceae bacterium]
MATVPCKNIVIVEDHPVMRKGLAAWFAETGRWKVLGTAASLEDAAALFCSIHAEITGGTADIVLLDIQLEGAWGLDLIPRLRERFGKASPPCVVYSAFDGWAYINAALNAGARGYVSKRSGEEELEKALQAVLAGDEYVEKSLREHLGRVTGMVERLTRRETEVWNLAREGLSSRRIGSRLGISPRTVDNILSIIYDKTGIRDRRELMKL